MLKRLDIPPVYFLASAYADAAPAPRLAWSSAREWPWRWLGLLPIIAGVALAIAGERAFKRAGTAVLPFSEPSVVITGPFAFTRNPIYLGLVLCLLGWAVLLGSFVPFVVVPAFFALIHFGSCCARSRSWPRGSAMLRRLPGAGPALALAAAHESTAVRRLQPRAPATAVELIATYRGRPVQFAASAARPIAAWCPRPVSCDRRPAKVHWAGA